MLSGAIGLQIIARRLGVELGEQQFNTITGVDDRELTFSEIKNLATNHSLVCKALNTKLAGLVGRSKNSRFSQLNNGRYVIVIKFLVNRMVQKCNHIDPKSPKVETIKLKFIVLGCLFNLLKSRHCTDGNKLNFLMTF